jgi:hypothetical protein
MVLVDGILERLLVYFTPRDVFNILIQNIIKMGSADLYMINFKYRSCVLLKLMPPVHGKVNFLATLR